MAEIPLTRGLVAIVDDADFDWLNQWRWHAAVSKGAAYGRRITQADYVVTVIHMHRVIAGAKPGELIDHKNRNGLDNRRANLRFATVSQNMQNRRGVGMHGFRGVSKYHRGSKPWMARGTIGGVYRTLGYYATPEEAARAHDRAILAEYGEFAVLNFPEEA
ncbi:MAG: AP2/ERF family transcription factor [Hyphomonadaceae bacterium]|nr:AP2/ERF family transcription factor [Hyphomonadaceae bacterium]